jgi:hypothetical protein
MSPALKKASPRVISAAISAADGCRLGGDCVGGGEVGGDVVGGVACFSAGSGEATDGGASGARAVRPGAAMARGKAACQVVRSSTEASAESRGVGCGIGSGVAVAAVSGGPETVARRSACVGSQPDLAAASGAACPDEATVPERTDGSPSIGTTWRDKNATMPRVNSIAAASLRAALLRSALFSTSSWWAVSRRLLYSTDSWWAVSRSFSFSASGSRASPP